MRKKEELIGLFVKLSVTDMQMINEMCESLGMGKSDFVRISTWQYAVSDKDGILGQGLKELARQKLVGYKIDVLKELEVINNRRAFYLDGFRTALNNFSSKHVPINYVKSFVRIKIVAIFSLFKPQERKDYVNYIKQHFNHHYSKHGKWLDTQIKYISSLKTTEKDKIFGRMRNGYGTMPQMRKMEGSVGMRGKQKDVVHELPSKKAKAEDIETKSQE